MACPKVNATVKIFIKASVRAGCRHREANKSGRSRLGRRQLAMVMGRSKSGRQQCADNPARPKFGSKLALQRPKLDVVAKHRRGGEQVPPGTDDSGRGSGRDDGLDYNEQWPQQWQSASVG